MSTLRVRSRLVDALPLIGIIAVAATAASIFALGLVQYVVMPDELTYSKESVAIAHGNLPTPGDFWFNSWALLRPLLMAPFYRWMSTPSAFDAAHVTGAIIMASTAWPAYPLTRRVTTWRPAALLVAASTVAIPWLAMSGTLMLEPIAYPAFTWAVLAMTDAVARPSPRSDLLLIVALAIAFFARTQLAVLGLAFVIAVVIDALLRRDTGVGVGRRLLAALRSHTLLIALTVAAAVLLLVSGKATEVLGAYDAPTHGGLLPSGTGSALHELLAYVVVGIGVVPLAGAAAWVAVTLGRDRPRSAHAFAATALAVVVLMALMAASFTVRFTEGINDRYLFYVAPLLFAGLVAGLVERPRRFTPALAVAGAASVWFVWTSKLAQAGPSLVSPSMPFHEWLQRRAAELGGWMTAPRLAAIGAAVVLAAVCVALPLTRARVVATAATLLVLAFGVAETAYTFHRVAQTQAGASQAFLDQRGWIDRSLPYGSRAALVLASVGDVPATTATWWDTSFWNATIRAVFHAPGANGFEQGYVPELGIDPKTGRVPQLDQFEYVVRPGNDTRFGLRGSSTVASSGAIVVLKAQRPYQANWVFQGPDPESAIVPPSRTATARAFGSPGPATLNVVVQRPPGDHGTTRYEISSGGRRERGSVAAGEHATVPLQVNFAAPGFATLTLKARGGGLELLEIAQAA